VVGSRQTQAWGNNESALAFQGLVLFDRLNRGARFQVSKLKDRFGRNEIEDWVKVGIIELPFGRQAAVEFASFFSHQVPDPMDRQIMAVARANGLGLITADRRILSLKFDWVIDATT
jgi:predicted nucleic acid-binding protein